MDRTLEIGSQSITYSGYGGEIVLEVESSDGTCLFRGCAEFGDTKRVTREGVKLSYCPDHAARAEEFFGV